MSLLERDERFEDAVQFLVHHFERARHFIKRERVRREFGGIDQALYFQPPSAPPDCDG